MLAKDRTRPRSSSSTDQPVPHTQVLREVSLLKERKRTVCGKSQSKLLCYNIFQVMVEAVWFLRPHRLDENPRSYALSKLLRSFSLSFLIYKTEVIIKSTHSLNEVIFIKRLEE